VNRRLFPRASNRKYIAKIKLRLFEMGVNWLDGVSLRDVVLAMAAEAEATPEPGIRS